MTKRRAGNAAFLRALDATEYGALRKRIRDGSAMPDANGCWLWERSTRNGYGQLSVHDATVYTHQLSYTVFVGPIPEGMGVCHTCDVRRCNNPEHFFLGSQADNVADMRAKGRGAKPPVVRGISHPKATLTDAQVAQIRARAAAGEKQRDIARAFGCSQSTVWRIAHEITRATG